MPIPSPRSAALAWLKAWARLGVPCALALGAAAWTARGAEPAAAEGVEFFENRIRPVLVERCYECHSTGGKRLKGGLHLDSREGTRQGGESGKPAVVPGEPGRSLLIEAIGHSNPDLQMPKEKLPAAVIADFEAWIRMGAPDPRTNAPATFIAGAGTEPPAPGAHWAFQPPALVQPPEVRAVEWTRNAIDRFILQRLEQEGLQPSPPADRRTLIRRLSLDLRGIPPAPGEVEAFASDTDPEAYPHLVDRLLASPQYGERWGRHWLDVARYADTKGYVYYYEESRFVHPHTYRDWVIRAFNEDLPYDRFLSLQIAADLILPDDPAVSPADTASTLRWPTPVRDPSVAALGFLTLGRRFLDLAPDIIDDRIDVLMRGTQALTVGCARCHDHKFDPIPTRDYYSLYGVFDASEERIVAVERPAVPDPEVDPDLALATVAFERGVRERVEALEGKYRKASDEVADRLRTRIRDYLEAVVDVARLPSDANVRPQPEDINPFNVRQWEKYLGTRTNSADPVFAPWHALAKLAPADFGARSPGVVKELLSADRPPLNATIARLLQSPPASMREVAQLYGEALGNVHREWQSSRAGANPPAALPDRDAEELRQVLYGSDAPVLVPPGRIIELDVHLYFDDPNRVALATLQMGLEQFVLTNRVAPLHAVVLKDRSCAAPPAVFRRGDPLQPAERVPRQFLEVLSRGGREPFGGVSGRLDLARAIASPANPLTARVMANRVWALHFGSGLVRTPSDFGLRSEPPTHPGLLDWLALRFVADSWSIKALHRLILCSATYQQEAAREDRETMRAARERDPENRWLWSFPRQRLDFESFRDSLLTVTGELDERMGGPADDLQRTPFSTRRTVYGFIDRKFLPGMYRAFDFANPDVHSPGRHATTMPQQALFLLNHPFLTGRARALARRTAGITAGSSEARIRRMYELAYQRDPTPAQLADATAFVRAALDTEPDSPSAKEKSPPLDPWEQLAQVLLVSNEFIFVD